jgi:hypothetical protein
MSLWVPYRDDMKTNNGPNDQWWTSLSSGEKDLIRALMRMVQSAKHSEVIEVARAARKWESGLTFFFKVRLKNQRPRWRGSFSAVSLADKNRDDGRRIISCQSNAHSQLGVSPGRG